MSGPHLPPDVVRARIDEIVQLWEGNPHEEIVMLRRDGQAVGLTLFGLAAHCYSLARAIRILDEADEGAQLVPLARQLLECSVTAMWVQSYGLRAALKIQREEARSRVAAFKEYVNAGFDDDGSTARWESEQAWIEPLTTRASEKFFQRAEELDFGRAAYATFRALSALSHAGGMVVELYLGETPGAEGQAGGVHLATHAKEWARDAVLGYTLIYLLHAALAWDTYDRDHPRRTRLKQIAAEMGMRLSWEQTATGQRRHREWEREQRALRRQRSSTA